MAASETVRLLVGITVRSIHFEQLSFVHSQDRQSAAHVGMWDMSYAFPAMAVNTRCEIDEYKASPRPCRMLRLLYFIHRPLFTQ